MSYKSVKSPKQLLVTYLLCILVLFLTRFEKSYSTSSTRESVIENIQQTVSTFIDSEMVPGIAVALTYKDKIIFSEGFGVSNIETQQKVTANTSFWLGSVSKTAVAVAIMHAQEQGLLNLEDNVKTVLKDQADFNLDTPFSNPITLQHIVTHTSSINDSAAYDCAYFVELPSGEHYNYANHFQAGNCDESVAVSLEGYLRAYFSSDGVYYSAQNNFLNENPGSRYEYSNVGTALAGLILQFSTGSSLAEYAKTHIFSPLGMNNTSWLLRDLDTANIAIPYDWDNVNNKMQALPIYSLSTWPDGGLRSSANDLAKYLLMVANGGEIEGTRILQEQTIKTMLAPTVAEYDPTSVVGVFWRTLTLANGQILVGHNGDDYGAVSEIDFDPINKTGITLVMNGIAKRDNNVFARYEAFRDKLLGYAKVLGDIQD